MTSKRPTASPPWLTRHYPKLLIALLAVAALAGVGYALNGKSPADHLAQAKVLQAKGDAKGAMIEIKSALQQAPNDPEVRYLLGQAHYTSGDFASAEKELEKVIELGRNADEARLLLAHTLIAMNKPERVIEHIKLSDTAPASLQARYLALKAKAQFIKGDAAAARASLEEADKLVPGQPETLFAHAQIQQALDDASGALALVEQALAKRPDVAEYWVTQGELLTALGRKAPALAAYDKALALAPLNIPARLAVIQGNIDAGDLDKAAAGLKILRAGAPNHLIGMYLDALLDFRRQRYQDAYAKLQPVVQGAPDARPARLLAGAVSSVLGKQEEALNHLNQVLRDDPGNALANKLMATTLLRLGQTDKAKAVVDAINSDANDPGLSALRGQVALQRGDFAGARAQLAKAVGQGASDPGVFLDLASSEERLGDQSAMFDALAKAAALDKSATGADLLLINAYIKNQRYDDAFTAVDGLARKQAPPALVHNVRGVIHTARRDFKLARASFEKALESDPTFLDAASNLAYLDIQARDFKSARARFEQVLKHAPNDSRAWLALAKIATVQRDEAGVRENLEKAKRADPRNVDARQLLVRYWLGKHNTGFALQEAREALAATGKSGFHELIGLALAQQGDKPGALEAFERWAHDQPDSPQALTRVGQAQAMLGKRKEALRTLDRAIALQPDFFAALASKMSVLAEDGRPNESIKLAQSLQNRYPNQVIGYIGEADALVAQQKWLDAARLYARSARMADSSRLLAKAAQTYVTAGAAAEGIATLQQWLKEHPEDQAIRRELAMTHEKAGQRREAIEHYRLLLRSTPKDMVAANNMALLLFAEKDPGAVAAAEQAYKLKPDSPYVQDTLGWILVHSGQAPRGIKLIKQAFDAMPDALELHWHYAAGLAAMGEPTLARFELERLLNRDKRFPQEAEARKLMASLKR